MADRPYRALRKAHGKTMGDVSDALGCSVAHVSACELGEERYSPRELDLLEAFLGEPVPRRTAADRPEKPSDEELVAAAAMRADDAGRYARWALWLESELTARTAETEERAAEDLATLERLLSNKSRHTLDEIGAAGEAVTRLRSALAKARGGEGG